MTKKYVFKLPLEEWANLLDAFSDFCLRRYLTKRFPSKDPNEDWNEFCDLVQRFDKMITIARLTRLKNSYGVEEKDDAN